MIQTSHTSESYQSAQVELEKCKLKGGMILIFKLCMEKMEREDFFLPLSRPQNQRLSNETGWQEIQDEPKGVLLHPVHNQSVGLIAMRWGDGHQLGCFRRGLDKLIEVYQWLLFMMSKHCIQVQWQDASECQLQESNCGKEVNLLMGFQQQLVNHCGKQAIELHGLIQQAS